MIQLLFHLWGDYLTQSDWMAQNKTKAHLPAAIHALIYGLPFLLIGTWQAVAVIVVAHFFIDRYRLTRYVVWVKNWMGARQQWTIFYGKDWSDVAEIHPGLDTRDANSIYHGTSTFAAMETIDSRNLPFRACRSTGYSISAPPWLAFWLLIIADNTLHLTINYVALRWM